MSAARLTFCHLSSALQRRHRGLDDPSIPDWVHPEAIDALSLDLPGPGRQAVIRVALREGIGGRALPRSWAPPGLAQATPLEAVRAPQAIAHGGAPGLERFGTPPMFGTAACLVRDRLAPRRNYLLTCGHVMAPTAAARAEDRARVDDGGRRFDGFLVEWQPAHGSGALRTPIDAALVEVTPADAVALQANPALLPHGVSSAYGRGMAVTLQRRSTPLAGALRIHWSGTVRLPVPDADEYPEFFLDDAIGYELPQPAEPGDSGAGVWNRRSELLGLHIGAIDDASQGEPNAILGRIAPVLDWFQVKPYLVGDPATLDAPVDPTRDDRPAPASAGSAAELRIVAQTIYGEASSEREEGMRAVGSVILNRVKRKHRGSTPSEICRAKAQFSCWNPGDANRARMEKAAQVPDAAYLTARRIAAMVCDRTLPDNVSGCLHYHVVGTLASWAKGRRPLLVIGKHAFYKDIDR
jgi:Cell Wall Hydrolase/Trypsin-like peptidase domain